MKVRYSRLWSFGNYENEKVELEEDFPSTMSYAEALTLLMKLVNNDHEIRVKIRDVSQRLGRRESDLKDFQTNNIRAGSLFTSEGVEASVAAFKKDIVKMKRQLSKLNKALLEV